jgi:hypothetical protein
MPALPRIWKAVASTVVVQASTSDALLRKSEKVKTVGSPRTIWWGARKPIAPGVCVKVGDKE